MNSEIFRQLADIETREMVPGHFSKIIHTENNTINYLQVKAGYDSAMHSHPHHQCIFVIKGQFEVTANGETQILDEGKFATIPGGVLHCAKAITDCIVLDIFNPVREDFKY